MTDLSHGDDGVLATVPDTLDVDVLGQIPDLFVRDKGIVISRVHDPGIVEL